jgi:hypothetical protein
VARPAGLEPATSWFVVVALMIYRRRPMAMKIPRLNNLGTAGNRPSTTITHRRSPSLGGVVSQFASQLDRTSDDYRLHYVFSLFSIDAIGFLV